MLDSAQESRQCFCCCCCCCIRETSRRSLCFLAIVQSLFVKCALLFSVSVSLSLLVKSALLSPLSLSCRSAVCCCEIPLAYQYIKKALSIIDKFSLDLNLNWTKTKEWIIFRCVCLCVIRLYIFLSLSHALSTFHPLVLFVFWFFLWLCWIW